MEKFVTSSTKRSDILIDTFLSFYNDRKMNIKPIVAWNYIGLLLFGGAITLNAKYMKQYDVSCPLAFEISVIYIAFVAFTISTAILMISTRLKQYSISYDKARGTINWLPQNYFVKMTHGLDFGKLHMLTGDREFIGKYRDTRPKTAISISAFCASRGSSSNKLLGTMSAWGSGVVFSIGLRMIDKLDQYSFVSAGIGLLVIGIAESQYNNWAWAHIVGLFIMLGGLETMIWHEYGLIDYRTIGIVVLIVCFLFFVTVITSRKLPAAIMTIVMEFTLLYLAFGFALWKYSFGCMYHISADI